MSTFTDGVPPSVTPEPDEDPESNGTDHGGWGPAGEDVTTGSLWLREEIQRRIVGGRAGSVGRHARRDTPGRTGSAAYVPRHSVPTPPAPSGRPGDAVRPDERGAPAAPTAPEALSGPPAALPNGQAASPAADERSPEPGSAAIGMPSLPRRRSTRKRDVRPVTEPPTEALPTQALPTTAPAPSSPPDVDGSRPQALRPVRGVPSAPALPRPPDQPARGAGGSAPQSPVAPPAGPAPAPTRPPAESRGAAAVRALLDTGDLPTVAQESIAPGEVTAPREATVPAPERASRPAVTLPPRRRVPPPPAGSPPTAVPPLPTGSRPTAVPPLPAGAPPTAVPPPPPVAAPAEAAPDADRAGPAQPPIAAAARTRGPGPTGPPSAAVKVPVQRDSDQLRGGGFSRTDEARTDEAQQAQTDAKTDAQSRRVRVVLAERKGVARPVRTVVDIQEGTGVGELLRSNLIGSQLAVALRFAVVAGVTLGVLPLLFALFPEIGRINILGLRLPWLLLGVLVYPFLLGLGWWHTCTAERVEQNFADHVQD